MSRSSIQLLLLLTFLAGFDGRLAAEHVWSVGRSTNDRDADLMVALIERQRFDDALSLCRMLARGADPEGDVTARWAIQQSEILVARQMGQEDFDDADVETIARPVTELLASYPEHRRRWFLVAQASMVQRSAALHRLLRAAVSPTDERARDEATASLLRATADLESIVNDIGDARSLLDRQTEDRPFAMIDDLARLQQGLQVETVSLALMQTELFTPGSNDYIAAAARAEQIADDVISRLPSDTKARREIERLKIESIVRAGQLDRADREWKQIVEVGDQPLSPRWIALQTRLDMAQGRMVQAAARLQGFYGDAPASAPRSIEMDLAKLEFLLRSDPGGDAGDWLEAIESRGGVYARRRAEAMALSLLGRSSASTTPTIDPSIIAAQGQDYLRRGDPGRAAELLAAAAQAETKPDRAIERAAEAAAAYGLVQKHREAAAILVETAIENQQAPQAPAAHLQAALLVATHDPGAVERLESMLRLNLETWPASQTSAATRAWLQKILIGQQRLIDAAEIAAAVSAEQVTPQTLDEITASWQAALQNRTHDSSEVSKRFLVAYQPLLSNQAAAHRFPLLVALLVDRELLGQVSFADDVGDVDPFAAALLAFRLRGSESDSLQSPPQDLVAAATERLMRDGRHNPVLRKSIANLLNRWDGNNNRSLAHAERLLWAGQTEASIQILHALIESLPGDGEVMKQSARLLATTGDAAATKEAIRLWDQLAAGATQGTPLWHEAKLSGITALRDAGQIAEAQRRAQYVLLTLPALEEEIRRQYEAFVR